MAKPTSLYIDLEDRTPEMLDYGIKGTDVYLSQASPHTLGNVPEFEGIKYATPDYNRYQDLYSLYLGGGFDAAQEDFPIQAEDIIGGDGGSGGTGTDGTIFGTGTGRVNTPEQQRLIDQGIGVQIAPGAPISAPGEGMLTQEAIDDLADYPINTEYRTPSELGDANVAEQFYIKQRADKARADERALTNLEKARTGQNITIPTYADTGRADLLELAGGESAGSDAGFYPQSTYDAELEDALTYIDSASYSPKAPGQNVVTRTEPVAVGDVAPGSTHPFAINKRLPTTSEDDLMDYREHYDMVSPITKQIPSEPFGTPVDFEQGFVQDYSVEGALGVDPREKVSGADAANPEGFLAKFGLDQFNVGEAIVKTAFNLAVGKPVTVFVDILKALAGPADPRLSLIHI